MPRGEIELEWIKSISDAVDYIEQNLDEDLSAEQIAKITGISMFYFQKGFAMLCGYTVGDYVRQRRLAQAASELVSSNEKVIDIAMRYGYDSPDSFTKAFTRFHGSTPTAVRRSGATIKQFAPLKITFQLKGGITMEYKIVDKEAFKVIGRARKFSTETSHAEIPKFWDEHFAKGGGAVVRGEFGICLAKSETSSMFDYLIADKYTGGEVPDDFTVQEIPAGTWAIFPCRGKMPETIQDATNKIFSEWLPNCRDYELGVGCTIEMYSDPSGCPNGMQDENYYSEIWLAIKKK